MSLALRRSIASQAQANLFPDVTIQYSPKAVLRLP